MGLVRTARSLAALNDPVLQEWVRFRCESLANYTNDLYDYVKSLNPDVVVHLNIKGLYSCNRYWSMRCIARFLPIMSTCSPSTPAATTPG